MKYTHPGHPHAFAHHDEQALEGMTFEQLNHMMYVDVAMSDKRLAHIDPMDLERMSDDKLRSLLADDSPVRPVKRANPFPAVIEQKVPLKRAPPRYPVPPRYKAQIWYQGKNHSLGWFLTEQVRDEVVRDAKLLRNMGLDPRIAKPR